MTDIGKRKNEREPGRRSYAKKNLDVLFNGEKLLARDFSTSNKGGFSRERSERERERERES